MSGLLFERSRVGLLVDHWRMILGLNLRRLTERPGFSQSGLAAHLKVSLPHVGRWVAGKSMPLKYLDQIVKYLRCDYRDLFEANPDAPLPPIKPAPPISRDEALSIVARELGFTIRKIKH